jgi:polyhydroxybutyrate depolymerase
MKSRHVATIAAAILCASVATAAPAAAGDAPRDHPVRTTGCGTHPDVAPGTSAVRQITSDGTERSFVLHVPASYDPSRPVAVVLAFHGRKGTGAELEEFSGLSTLPALVAYPDGLPVDGKTAWEGAPYAPDSDDVLFVSDLLDHLQASYCIDNTRIFATGKSNGGGFTALLACRMQHRIAAFASVAGAYYPQSRVGCHPGRPVSIMEFHGLADTIIEYAGGESHGAPFPAVTDWLADWVDHDHCRSAASDRIEPDVTRFSWTDCAGGAEVVHFRIDGAGHTWPGELANSGPGSATQTISATSEMWQFFQRHPLH